MLAAINVGANVREFINDFQLTYTVGEADNAGARRFMQFPEMQMAYVPWIVFIDRNGQIRHQFTGSDQNVLSDIGNVQEKQLRGFAEALLNEKAAPPAKAAPAKTAPKKK